MKRIRSYKFTYFQIATIFEVDESTIRYHLKVKRRITETKSPHSLSYSTEYIREYMRDRYREDPEFRQRRKMQMRKYWRKKHSRKKNLK